jgi:hypothetical protein
MRAVVKALERIPEITVVSATYDKSVMDGLKHVNSLLRTIWVETDSPQAIPHAINWQHEGQSGQSLVTMRNRAPVCLRCFQGGHMRKDCPLNLRCRVCARSGHDDPSCTQVKSWASVGAAKPNTDFIAGAQHSSLDMETENVLQVDPVLTHETTTHSVTQLALPSDVTAHEQEVTYATVTSTPGATSTAAPEGGATETVAKTLDQTEWPTLQEAKEREVNQVCSESPETVVTMGTEPDIIPETQESAIAEVNNTDQISQFSSLSVDVAQDLALSEDYETSDDRDQVLHSAKTRHSSTSSSTASEMGKYTKDLFLKAKPNERNRSRSVAKTKRRRKQRKN